MASRLTTILTKPLFKLGFVMVLSFPHRQKLWSIARMIPQTARWTALFSKWTDILAKRRRSSLIFFA
jgi:hypothetical protein